MQTIFVANTYCGDGTRFVARVDEELTGDFRARFFAFATVFLAARDGI
jgi:hypothetical protein